MAIIPFGEWLPDLASLGSHATVAKNVQPSHNSYKSIKSLVVYTTALDAYCRGAVSFTDADGNNYTYAGNASKLYILDTETWTNISVGGGYSSSSDSYWEFAKWGDKILATNFGDAIQVDDLGSSSFAALSGSPPKARHIAVVKDFVVVGNTYDAVDGNVPHRVRWSGIGDETSWTVSAATQADYQDLQGHGGWVERVLPGNRGIVFQERAIWMMTYVGSPLVFQFDQVDSSRGAITGRSVVQVGNTVFYLAEDGFYAFRDGSSVPISEGKTSRWFLSDFDLSYKHRMCGAVDVERNVIYWLYAGVGNTNGTPNRIIMYHWPTGKWSHADVDAEYLFSGISSGYTLEGLNDVSSSLDALEISLDSRYWTGGDSSLYLFDTSHKMGALSGSSLSSTMETAEFQPNESGTSEVSWVRPVVDGGTHTANVASRFTQAATASWIGESAEEEHGACPFLSNGRYHKVRVSTTGNFNEAMGIEVHAIPSGDR